MTSSKGLFSGKAGMEGSYGNCAHNLVTGIIKKKKKENKPEYISSSVLFTSLLFPATHPDCAVGYYPGMEMEAGLVRSNPLVAKSGRRISI